MQAQGRRYRRARGRAHAGKPPVGCLTDRQSCPLNDGVSISAEVRCVFPGRSAGAARKVPR